LQKKVLILLSVCFTLFGLLFSSAAGSYYNNVLLQKAGDFYKKGRFLEALSFYKDIYMNDWADGFAGSLYKGLGDIYFEYLGDLDNALKFYTEILEKIPDDKAVPSVCHSIAKIYYKKGEPEKSSKFYKDILSRFPAYYIDNNLENELKALEKGVRFDDDLLMAIDRHFPVNIRVMTGESQEPVNVFSKGVIGIYSSDSSCFNIIKAGKTVSVSCQKGAICIDNKTFFKDAVRIKSESKECVEINGVSYRGFFWIYIMNNRLVIINHVNLEEYLYGVLPREISPSWPEPALKAQAVAARTYALYHMVKREKELYDVFSTTASQVYGGRDSEYSSTRKAVDLTKGLILSYKKKIVLALYHSNSGGETEKAEDVWGSRLPYLGDLKDKFSEDMPGFKWEKTLSREEIEKSMKEFGIQLNSIEDIIPLERAASGRIKKLKILQAKESFYLSGNSFRLIVGPGKVKSSNFEAFKQDDKFIFKGKGYGHGVGMSQWGAYGMAKAGHDYKEILNFYYNGTEVNGLLTQ
jgi:stage II sporulation protein D